MMHMLQRTTLEILLLLALAPGATTAQAQAMFRSVMPDGKIVYSDKPAPGAKESKRVNLAPLNIATPQQASDTAAVPPGGATAAANGEAELTAARKNLEAAQKALAEGREQREGDRIGIAKGGSRPSDSYLDRVKGLEDAVTTAQQQLENAQRSAR
jgi:hypothetical protein